MTDRTPPTRINGLDTGALRRIVQAVSDDAGNGRAQFRVRTVWTGGTRTESRIDHYVLGGATIERRHKIVADEPIELGGGDSASNPQELLMAAVCACMVAGYAANAAARGIRLTLLEIEMQGELDLRGFLGIDPDAAVGHRALGYRVRIAGDASREQFDEIHAAVRQRSPNLFNVLQAVPVEGALDVL